MLATRFTLTLAALVLFWAIAFADEPHDHSRHVEEGAVGSVQFPTTCAAALQPDFDRAVGFLHSFGFEVAREGFEAIARQDPDCAMAWWGVATTYYHPIWAPPSAAELAAGGRAAAKAAEIGGGDDREKGFISAIGKFYADADRLDHKARAAAYRDALKEMSERFPDDPEPKVFYALLLLGTASPKDPDHVEEQKAAAILNGLLERYPQHPGIVHYLIHSFDYPQLATLALPAARVYARIAPASPHAQHMPSHIFTRLGLWKESVASNLDSERSANAIVAEAHPGVASYDALHALDYLVYAYLQTCEDDLAKQSLERMAAARTFDAPNFVAGYALAAAPARYALERRQWSEVARLPALPESLPWDQYRYAVANLYFARAIGGARSGDASGAGQALAEIEPIRDALRKAPPAGPYDWAGQVESLRLAAAGWVAHAEGETDAGLNLLREAADLQDAVGKHPVTPGELLPARELLADLLLESGKAQEALAAYETALASAPGRLNSLYGAEQAARATGETKKAETFRAQIAAQCVGEHPRAGIARVPEPASGR